jgi:hypothetical protein
MRQRIDVAKLYADALEQPEGVHYDGVAARPAPAACPFTLDTLLENRRSALEQTLHETLHPE